MTTLSYRTLFSIQIQHGYFLNNGEQTFEEMTAAERSMQLALHDWRDYLEISPTGSTRRELANHHLLEKKTPQSLIVLVRTLPDEPQQSFVPLDPDLALAFSIRYKDPLFENYTEMEFLEDRKIFLANRPPDLSEPVDFAPIPLPQQEGYFSGDYVQPASAIREIMQTETGDNKGLIYITMIGQSGDWNVINVNGTIKVNPTVFRVAFHNRSTFWKYIHRSAAFEVETLERKPLTKSGFVSLDPSTDFDGGPDDLQSYQFPNPSIKYLKRDNIKIFSEIYI